MKFLRDLLAGPDNLYWDLGRILAALGSLTLIGGAVWNVLLGLPVELGPTGLGGGFAALFTSCAALIYAKDRAKAEATAMKAESVVNKAVAESIPPASPPPAGKRDGRRAPRPGRG